MGKTKIHHRSGFMRLLAALLCAVCVFGLVPTQAFALSPGQKASSWLNVHLAHHLTDDNLNVLVVDFHALLAVHRLNGLDQVVLNGLHAGDPQHVLGIQRACTALGSLLKHCK